MANINVTVSDYLADSPYDPSDTYTLADTGANIAALSASQFADLSGNGIAKINATDNVLSLSVAQYQGLGEVLLAAGDVITLADTGTNIAALSATDIAALADAGIDKIDSTTNALSLTVAQYQALGTVALTSSDTVKLVDTGATLSALSATSIAALAAAGVDQLDASNNVLSLTLAQYQALGGVTVAANDSLTLSGTGASIGALSVSQIAGLAAAGFDKINATDNVLSLSVAQYQALGTVLLVPGDVITLADTGANIAALSASDFAALADAGIDKIDATDNVLNLTAAQLAGLGTVELASGDVVTLADTGANIAALTATQIAALGTAGVDAINASDDALSLSIDQAQALGSVTLTGADAVTLADTGTNLAALTTTQLAALASAGFDTIYASDGAVTFSLAQIAALGTMALTPANTVIAQATVAQIAALTTTEIAALAQAGVDLLSSSNGHPTVSLAQAQAIVDAGLWFSGSSAILTDSSTAIEAIGGTAVEDFYLHGITRIDATDDVLSLSVDQIVAVDDAGVALTQADVVTLADSASALGNLSASTIDALAQLGVDRIDATDNALTLTVAQFEALDTIALTSADTVTLADTAANLQALSAATIGTLAGLGIDAIHATGGTLSLTVAQAQALGAVSLTASDTVTLADTAAQIQALSATQIAALASAGIDRIDSSDNTLSLTAAQAAALGTIVLAAADAVTLADTGAHIAALSATSLAALAAAGVDAVDASDNVLALSVAQAQALAGVTLAGGDTITLADTGTHIAALDAAALTALAGRGFDAIDASDNVLTLSLAQVLALDGMALTAGDLITVVATGTQFAALTAQDFADLSAMGVDALSTTDHALTLTVAQAQALGGLALAAGDTVTLADAAATIEALSASDLADLIALGIDHVAATSGVLELSVVQALALDGATLSDGGLIVDTGASLEALDAAQWAVLATIDASAIQVTDNTLTLDTAQVLAMGTLHVSTGDALIVADTGAALAALTPTQLAALADKSPTYVELNASDDQLVLSHAQFVACQLLAFANGDSVAIADTAQALHGLSVEDIADIAARGVVTIAATDATLVWSLDQVHALGNTYITSGTEAVVELTPAELAAITVQELADLADHGIDVLTTSDGAPVLTVAQFQALGTVELLAQDSVTLADTGAHLADLDAATLANLKDAGIDVLSATDGTLALSFAQFEALNGLAVDGNTAFVLNDSGATIEGLSTADLDALNAAGLTRIDASDNAFTLSVDQALALGNIALSNNDVVTLEDTAAAIGSLSRAEISTLIDLGVSVVHVTDAAVTLALPQFNALAAIDLVAPFGVVLADSGDILSALTAAEWNTLIDRGVDTIDVTAGTLVLSIETLGEIAGIAAFSGDSQIRLLVSAQEMAGLTLQDLAYLSQLGIDELGGVNGTLSLTLAQFDGLAGIALIPGDTVTLTLDAADFAALSAGDLQDLADLGIDVLDLGDQTVTITVDQANALGGLSIIADQFTLDDTALRIEDLAASELAALVNLGVTTIHASDGTLALDLAQASVLVEAGVTVSDDDGVALLDSATAIATLAPAQIAALAASGFTMLDATGDLTLSLDQAQALGSMALGSAYLFTVEGSGTALGALSAAALGALDAAGVDRIDATDNAITLSLDQLAALDNIALTPDDVVTLSTTGTALAALSAGDLAHLVAQGVDRITVSGSADLSLAQLLALDGAHFTADATVTLVASGATLAGMSDGDVALARDIGLTNITLTDHAVTLSVLRADELSGLAWDAQARITLADSGGVIADYLAQHPDDFASLPVVRLDATDDLFTFSLAQLAQIAGIAIGADDAIILADTGQHLAALTPEDIDGLALRGVTTLTATDGTLSIGVESWWRAMDDGIGFGGGTEVVLADSGATLANLDASALAQLADGGVTRIDASDNLLVLSYDQFLALGNVALTAQDTVKLWFNGDTLATLSVQDITALANAGVDMVSTLGNTLTIDIATLNHLLEGGLALDQDITVRLPIDAESLASAPPQGLASLGDFGIDVVYVTGALSLSVAQFEALGAIQVEDSSGLSVADSGAVLGALSTQQLAALADRGVNVIDATDGTVHFTLDQLEAMGSMYVAGSDLAVADLTAEQAAGIDNPMRALLGQHGIDAIAISQGTLTLGLSDLWRYNDYRFVGGNVVVAEDSATLQSRAPADFEDLVRRGITAIDATDDVLVLSLAQFTALGPITLTNADDVTIQATAADLAALPASVYAAMSASGVDTVEVTGGALQLTADQAGALDNVQLSSSAAITLVDTGAAIAALSADTIGGLAGSGITGIDATTGITINAVKYEALGGIRFALSDVVTVASNHSFTAGVDVDNVSLTGTKNLVAIGNSGANVLTGNAGRNTLDGGAGNDRLIGGAGRDVLTGGGGADKFIFRDGDFGGNTATTADRITDFSRGSRDSISLIGVDANTHTVGDDAFSWIGTSAFHHVAGELRYAQISGNTYIQGDTNGDGLSDFWIRLDGLVNLQATDFQL